MFRINQYNVTIVSQSRGKSQLVSELGPAQPQLVFHYVKFYLLFSQFEVRCALDVKVRSQLFLCNMRHTLKSSYCETCLQCLCRLYFLDCFHFLVFFIFEVIFIFEVVFTFDMVLHFLDCLHICCRLHFWVGLHC